MKCSLLMLGMLGCYGAAPPVAPPVANTKPPVKRAVVALTDAWPSATGTGDLVARTPAGPYPSLSAVCAALDRPESEDKFEGCHTNEDDELGGGAFVRTGVVTAWEPLENANDMPVRLAYLALQTRAGWYVLPRLGDTGNRYSSLWFETERAGSGILVHYNYDLSTAGRFASEVEEGVIACEVVGGTAACTPKLATHAYSMHMETSKPDWPTSTDVSRACTASYAKGAITLAPMPKPDGDDGTWTAEAAARCSETHTVTF